MFDAIKQFYKKIMLIIVIICHQQGGVHVAMVTPLHIYDGQGWGEGDDTHL